MRLEGLAERLPRELSGGQQQRVALARALVIEPDILLLDEPLSNLDAKLRHEVRVEIRELQKKLGLTTVMVTHDQEEALTMADRLVVMSNGQVQQVGSQRDLYENPANTFVAGFVGRTNFLHGRVETPGLFRSESGLAIRCDESAAAHGRTLALRPERLSLAAAPVAGADNCFPGTVEFASYLGGILEYYVRLTPQDRLMVQAPNKICRSRARGRRSDPSALARAGQPRACRRWRQHGLIDETPSRDREVIDMEKHSSDITRRRLMKAAGALAGVAAIGGWSPARAQAGGRVVARHLGRRLFEAPVEEHRHAADGAEEVRGRARHRRRSRTARQDARRSAAAARHERPAGTLSRADVRDERRRPVPARSTTRRSRTRSTCCRR